jgi:AbiV family abortive infection protein
LSSKKFATSHALSVISIEESAKALIINAIYLELDEPRNLWKAFRDHKAKSNFLNPSIKWMARAQFPGLDDESLRKVAKGPSPDFLERMKHLGLYIDCIQTDKEVVWHKPQNNEDWERVAEERLYEAMSMAYKLRDYSPEELEIWYKHLRKYNKKSKKELKESYKALEKELIEKKFIKKGWWVPILEHIDNL